jgi:hypothetical protein
MVCLWLSHVRCCRSGCVRWANALRQGRWTTGAHAFGAQRYGGAYRDGQVSLHIVACGMLVVEVVVGEGCFEYLRGRLSLCAPLGLRHMRLYTLLLYRVHVW